MLSSRSSSHAATGVHLWYGFRRSLSLPLGRDEQILTSTLTLQGQQKLLP